MLNYGTQVLAPRVHSNRGRYWYWPGGGRGGSPFDAFTHQLPVTGRVSSEKREFAESTMKLYLGMDTTELPEKRKKGNPKSTKQQ